MLKTVVHTTSLRLPPGAEGFLLALCLEGSRAVLGGTKCGGSRGPFSFDSTSCSDVLACA